MSNNSLELCAHCGEPLDVSDAVVVQSSNIVCCYYCASLIDDVLEELII